MFRTLITNTVAPEVLAPLSGIAEVIQGPSSGDLMARHEVLALAPTLDAIINQAELRVDSELLDRAPNLKIVANVSLGIDNLDLAAMTKKGVWATNAPNAFVQATADCTMGLILAVCRKMTQADRYIRAGQWKGFQPGVWDGVLLSGKTLGIVGYGKIGKEVARRARAFGMRILWNTRTRSDDPDYRNLDELLGESDLVSLHVPQTPETIHLLDEKRISKMKFGAFLINMARGRVVKEVALVEALKSGRLAGAGLDVFEFEPAIHPQLITMDNVVMTPHIGGGTRESRHEARLWCAKNVALVLAGRPPVAPINQI